MSKILLAFLIYSSLIAGLFGLDIKELHDDDALYNVVSGNDTFLVYKYTFRSIPQDKNFYVILQSQDYSSDPDIYISSKSATPDLTNSEVNCTGFGADICFIPKNLVVENKTFYFKVFCKGLHCRFVIKVGYLSTTSLELGEETYLQVNETENLVLRVNVPEVNNVKYIYFYSRIVSQSGYNQEDKDLEMFVNKGEAIPTKSGRNLETISAWDRGKLAMALNSPAYPFFCTNCNFTVTLIARPGALIHFKTIKSEGIKNISLSTDIFDAVLPGQTRHYRLVISPEALPAFVNEDLFIDITPYQGNPDIFVNPDALLINLGLNKWKSMDWTKESMVIPASERKGNTTGGDFFITIYGRCYTTYKLNVYTGSKQGKVLKLGESETGFYSSPQVISYRMILDATPIQESNPDHHGGAKNDQVFTLGYDKLQIGLFLAFGDGILMVKKCNSSAILNCQVSQAEIDSEEDALVKGLEHRSPETVFALRITQERKEIGSFTVNNTQHCQPAKQGNGSDSTTKFMCYFAIGFKALCPGGAVCQGGPHYYRVLVENQREYGTLVEGVPTKSEVGYTEQKYYLFRLSDDTNVTSVHFQVTPLAGDVALLVSRTNPRPFFDNFEQIACLCNNMVVYPKFPRNESLVHTYYLTVFGYGRTVYTLTAYLRRTDSDKMNNAIQLIENVPQRHIIQHEPGANLTDLQAYFTFMVNYHSDDKKDEDKGVHVHIKPIKGSFTIYGSEGSLPTTSVHSAAGNTTRLNIPKQKDGNGRFFVMVSPNSARSHDNQFLIWYNAHTSLTSLQPNYVFKSSLEPSGKEYFTIELLEGDAAILINLATLSTLTDSSQLRMFISTSSVNAHPNEMARDFACENKEKTLGTCQLTFLEPEIKRRCQFTTNGNHKLCLWYISVHNDNREEVKYSIYYTKNTTFISFDMNRVESFPLPPQHGDIKFYIYPDMTTLVNNSDKVTVVATTLDGNINLRHKILDARNHTQKSKWALGFNESSEEKEGYSNFFSSKSIVINKTEFGFCEHSCILMILVHTVDNYREHSKNKSVEKYIYTGEFTLLVSNDILSLEEGRQIVDQVEALSYKYYDFNVQDDDVSILISLTPYDGCDPDLLVSFGEGQRPTIEQHHWTSRTYSVESMSINKASKSEKFWPTGSMKGHYTIGIYGNNRCLYSLNAAAQKIKMFEVSLGHPMDITFTDAKSVYNVLKTAVTETDAIVVSLAVLYGGVEVKTQILDGNTFKFDWLSIVKKFQSSGDENNVMKAVDGKNKSMITFEISTSSCKNGSCYYVFQLKPNQGGETKLRFSLEKKEILTYFEVGRPIYDLIETRKVYYTYLDKIDDMEIILLIYHGDGDIYISNRADVSKENALWHTKHQDSQNEDHLIEAAKMKKYVFYGNELRTKMNDGDFLYFAVYTEKKSNIQITINQLNKVTTLLNAIYEFGSLKAGQSKMYLFYCNVDDEELESPWNIGLYSYESNVTKNDFFSDLKLYFDGVGFSKSSDISLELKWSPATTNLKKIVENFDNLEQGNILNYINMNRIQNLAIEPKKGVYLIRLSHKSSNASLENLMNYAVVANRQGLLTLFPNTYYFSFLQRKKPVDAYEIYIPDNSNVLIEVNDCFGVHNLTLAEDIKTHANIPSRDNLSVEGNHFALYDVTQGTYLLRVNSENASNLPTQFTNSQTRGFYKVNLKTLAPNHDIPYRQIKPGSDGNLVIEWLSPQRLRVTYTEIEISDTLKLAAGKERLSYEGSILIAKDKSIIELFSKCREYVNNWNIKSPFHMLTYEYSTLKSNTHEYDVWLPEDLQNNTIYVTLVIKIKGEAGFAYGFPNDLSIYYQPTYTSFTSYNEAQHLPPFKFLKVLICIALIVLVLAVVYLIRRAYLRRKSAHNYATTHNINEDSSRDASGFIIPIEGTPHTVSTEGDQFRTQKIDTNTEAKGYSHLGTS